MRLHLVRHGKPSMDRSAPAATWPLDPSATEAVDALRDVGVLPEHSAQWLSSTEPKAVQTARLLHSGEILLLDELREQRRPAEWLGSDEFTASVLRGLEQPQAPARAGWETADAVRRRVLDAFHGTVLDIFRTTTEIEAGAEVVLVGHGTAWTLLVAALTGRSPDLDAWQAMTMPDHCLLEMFAGATAGETSATLVSGWGSWRG